MDLKTVLKVADFFGLTKKARAWLQGKKTYTINVVQAIAGVAAMLTLAGQMLDLVAKSLTLVTGWSDGGQGSSDAFSAVEVLWRDHAVLVAGFSAGFYAVTDAFSKMASYAQRRRVEAARAAQPDFIGPIDDPARKP